MVETRDEQAMEGRTLNQGQMRCLDYNQSVST